jgi:hypothetical protein
LTKPPLNLPTKEMAVPKESPTLPQGAEPALLALSGGERVVGTLTLSGRLTVRGGKVELLSSDKRSIQVLYRLPPTLVGPKEVDAPGDLSIVDLSSPGGPSRRIVVRSGGSMVMTHVALKSPEPARVDLDSGLYIRQRALPPSGERSLLIEVPVDVSDDGAMVKTIPVGETTTAQRRRGNEVFNVFVITSHMAYSSDPAEKGWWYLFEAWVVRSNG